jgi:hypothetical protein
MSQFRRILYASDFSPASRPAFRRALGLARANRASLTIAHVSSIIIPMMGEGYATAQVTTSDRRHPDGRSAGRSARGPRRRGSGPRVSPWRESPTTASCVPPDPRGRTSSCSGPTVAPASAGFSWAASPHGSSRWPPARS